MEHRDTNAKFSNAFEDADKTQTKFAELYDTLVSKPRFQEYVDLANRFRAKLIATVQSILNANDDSKTKDAKGLVDKCSSLTKTLRMLNARPYFRNLTNIRSNDTCEGFQKEGNGRARVVLPLASTTTVGCRHFTSCALHKRMAKSI